MNIKLVCSITFLLITTEMLSCSCIGFTREKVIDEAYEIVTGKVISKELVKNKDKNSSFTYTKAKYSIIISERHKGKIKNDTIAIYTGLGGGDCGHVFEIGSVYTIFISTENLHMNTKTEEKVYSTNICTRTNLYKETEQIEIVKYCKVKGYS